MEDKDLLEIGQEEPYFVSFSSFWNTLRSSLLVMILIVVLCGLAGVGVSLYKRSVSWTAKCVVVVKLSVDVSGSSDEQTVANNTSLAKSYLPTMRDIFLSPKTVAKASSYNGYSISSGSMGISISSDSLIMTIYYTDATAESAKMKLEDVLAASQEKIDEEKPIVATEIKLVKSQPDFEIVKNENNGTSYIVLGVGVGLLFACAYTVLRFLFENKINSVEELENLTGGVVLSVIKEKK